MASRGGGPTIARVWAYVTRNSEPAEATSAIGGVEVHAELRGTDMLCTAQLSDFGPGDLVVVQVEMGVFRCWRVARIIHHRDTEATEKKPRT
jgi:hypothetical protein